MHGELGRLPHGRPWRVAVGRPYPGLYGIARSYEEAREGLTMAGRLRLDTPLSSAEHLLIYRVLLRDQPAIVDLVQAVLSPLVQARGGAEPLLATLDAYFATGRCRHRDRRRRLHLSVRTVTYRLDRVKALTGYDPADPAHGSPSTRRCSERNCWAGHSAASLSTGSGFPCLPRIAKPSAEEKAPMDCRRPAVRDTGSGDAGPRKPRRVGHVRACTWCRVSRGGMLRKGTRSLALVAP